MSNYRSASANVAAATAGRRDGDRTDVGWKRAESDWHSSLLPVGCPVATHWLSLTSSVSVTSHRATRTALSKLKEFFDWLQLLTTERRDEGELRSKWLGVDHVVTRRGHAETVAPSGKHGQFLERRITALHIPGAARSQRSRQRQQ